MTIEYDVLQRRVNGVKVQIQELMEDSNLDIEEKTQALDEIIEYADEVFQDMFGESEPETEDKIEE